jgi:hypothetical protein
MFSVRIIHDLFHFFRYIIRGILSSAHGDQTPCDALLTYNNTNTYIDFVRRTIQCNSLILPPRP